MSGESQQPDHLRASALMLNPMIMEVDDFALGPIYGIEHGSVHLQDIVDGAGWEHAMEHPEVERFMERLAMMMA